MNAIYDQFAALALYPIFMEQMNKWLPQWGWEVYDVGSIAVKRTRQRLYTRSLVEMRLKGQTDVQPLYNVTIEGYLRKNTHGEFNRWIAKTIPSDEFKGYADFDPKLGRAHYHLHECLRSFCERQTTYLYPEFIVKF